MFLKDIKEITEDKVEVIKEAEFDTLLLLGKGNRYSGRLISYIESLEYAKQLKEDNVSAVICSKDIVKEILELFDGGVCATNNPRKIFWEIHNYLYRIEKQIFPTQIAESAIIEQSAIISENNVIIGNNVVIMPNVIIKEDVIIGDNTTVHENVIIGKEGFYYYGDGNEKRLVQSAGKVFIGKNVDIHTNTVIAKGVLCGDTIIGDNTKIGTNCIIGHDAVVGKNCTITPASFISGGTIVGDDSYIGLSTTTLPYVKIGNRSKTAAGCVVDRNVPDDSQIVNFEMRKNHIIKLR